MDVTYRTNQLKRACTDFGVAQREYGLEMAEKIHQRIGEIKGIELVELLVQFNVGRCHPLTGDMKGLYAMDLVQPHRLIFEKHQTRVRCVRITKIEVDYH